MIVAGALHIVARCGAVAGLRIVGVRKNASKRNRILNTVESAKDVTVGSVAQVEGKGADSVGAPVISDV